MTTAIDPMSDPHNALKLQAIQKVLALGLLGVGGGAALGALSGAKDTVQRNISPPMSLPNRQVVIPLRYPVEREKKADGLAGAAKAIGNAAGAFHPAGQPRGGLTGAFWGDSSSKLHDRGFMLPAMAAALVGGPYLGYKAISALLNKSRVAESQSEVDSAKQEYEQELSNGLLAKSAAVDDPLVRAFKHVKAADSVVPSMNQLMGLALLGGGTAAGLSGLAAYRWGKGNNSGDAMEEALKRREMELYARSPRPVIAVPVPEDDSQKSKLPRIQKLLELTRIKSSSLGAKATAVFNRLQAETKARAAALNPPPPAPKKPRPAAPAMPSVPAGAI